MKRRAFLSSALVGIAVFIPGVARACSFHYDKGQSPPEIKRRSDVRKVKGTYRLNEISGERFVNDDGEERIRDAMLLGTIEARRGRVWETIHAPPYHDLDALCDFSIYYHKPEADATGTFWLARKSENGRYQLLHWEGDYLPKARNADKKD